MIFLPYRAQIELHKIPVVTIALAALCLLIYFFQDRGDARVEAHAQRTCAPFGADAGRCAAFVLDVFYAADPKRRLDAYGDKVGAGTDAADTLRAWYRAFAERAPASLTKRLWHDRSRFDPAGMFTSTFAHGSWAHVVFNVIFFYAFAAAVELVLGPALFLAVIVSLAFGIGLLDHFISGWLGNTGPSVGLSGVVMGMLGLFVYFLPRAKIRFVYWFLLWIGRFGIPVWFVAIWYIGGDLYDQLTRTSSPVNFIAHLSGAALGLLIGIVLFRHKRHWSRELVLEKEERTFEGEAPFILAGSALLGMGVLALLAATTAVVMFVERFWVQLALLAPVALAGYAIFRSRRADRAVRGRYELGVVALERREYEHARNCLEPLARENDTRALYALGNVYAGATGALRDESRAVELYARAAARGHALAQYALGAMYADGRGVPGNPVKAAEYYGQAARAGVPDAANSLGYVYENGIGVAADREKAIEWYYRAGVGFHKAQRRDDALAVVRHLESLATQYPAVIALLAKLKGLIAVKPALSA